MSQALQIVGAVTILGAFTLAQLRVLDVQSRTYLVANAVGAALLAVLAWHEAQWGFFLLEGVWTLVSLFGLLDRTRATTRR